MRFIADSMLGRLARWLRLLGHDTLYYPHIEDSLLLRIAREQQRTLLTRDTRLVQVRGLKNYLLLSENDPFEQLKRVITACKLMPADMSDQRFPFVEPGRCSLCNNILTNVRKELARDHVPHYVYDKTETFKTCIPCGKFYWEGSHQNRIRQKLKELL